MKSSPQPAKQLSIAYPKEQINPNLFTTAQVTQLPGGSIVLADGKKKPVAIAKKKKKKPMPIAKKKKKPAPTPKKKKAKKKK